LIRIVFVITGLEVGGAETMLAKMLERLCRTKFEPIVISLQSGGPLRERIQHAGVRLIELGMAGPAGSPTAAVRLASLARELRPDVIQGWMYHGNLAAVVMHSALRKRPHLLWSIRITADSLGHEKRLTRWMAGLGARLSTRPHRIIYNSTRSADQHAELGYSSRGALIIPNGFNPEKYKPCEERRAAARERFGLDAHTPVVGIVGRHHPIKDHDGFLVAARLVLDERPDVKFLMVGKGLDQANPAIAGLVESLGLEGACVLAGAQARMETIYPAMDIHVSSSVSEGFPNVLGEAMCCGVPCVATDVGDSAAIVADTGIAVPPRAPSELARAILALIGEDRDEHERRSAAARQRVVEQYSLSSVVRQYEQLYATLIEERKGCPSNPFVSSPVLTCEVDKQ
jgi:glycosyltransferase involved in cell wall biosynthesis